MVLVSPLRVCLVCFSLVPRRDDRNLGNIYTLVNLYESVINWTTKRFCKFLEFLLLYVTEGQDLFGLRIIDKE